MRAIFALSVLLLCQVCVAQAQLVLPGAVPPTGAPLSGQGPAKAKRPAGERARTAPARVPGEDGVLGQDLSQNGDHGRIIFGRTPEGLTVTALTMDGSQISRPDDSCRVDVIAGTPMMPKAAGRPVGALRYELELAACPFSFDILEGAILVAELPAACKFTAADCQVDPAGLWGPRSTSFSPERIKEIERSRPRAEATMRENFRELLARTKGKSAIKSTAGDQAGFSSIRAQICRSYAREDVHGFCTLRLTEARALALKVMVAQASQDIADKKPERKKRGQRGAVPM